MTVTTPQDIHDYKTKWLPGYTVAVHSDLDSQCKDWCKANLEKQQWKQTRYTHVYAHTYHFETPQIAEQFVEEFDSWVNVGTQ